MEPAYIDSIFSRHVPKLMTFGCFQPQSDPLISVHTLRSTHSCSHGRTKRSLHFLTPQKGQPLYNDEYADSRKFCTLYLFPRCVILK